MLARIAETAGFGTLRHFLRQFEARMGLTPNEFRNRYRMMHVNAQ